MPGSFISAAMGVCGTGDIFNQPIRTGAGHYAKPLPAESPVKQGFALHFADGRVRPLDITGFPGASFSGEYPIGTVEYHDNACPLDVKLEAFSPFVPLNTPDSSLPATILHFTLRNTSNSPVDATLVGSLENAILLHHREVAGKRLARRVAGKSHTFLDYSVEKSTEPPLPPRPDVLFEDWNKETYEGWSAEGDAFGSGPVLKSKIHRLTSAMSAATPRVSSTHTPAPPAQTRPSETTRWAN